MKAGKGPGFTFFEDYSFQFNTPSITPEESADWATGHVLANAREPLVQFFSGSVPFEDINWSGCTPAKMFRFSAVYVGITKYDEPGHPKEGKNRAGYVGLGCSGYHDGSAAVEGPNSRDSSHWSQARVMDKGNSTYSWQKVYESPDGFRSNDYSLYVVMAWHDDDFPTVSPTNGSVSTGAVGEFLTSADISVSIGDMSL